MDFMQTSNAGCWIMQLVIWTQVANTTFQMIKGKISSSIKYHHMSLVTTLLVNLRLATSTHLVWTLQWTVGICKKEIKIHALLYVLPATIIYVALWSKHRMIFSHPILKTLINKPWTKLSYIALGLILTIGLLASMMYTIPHFTTYSWHPDHNGSCVKIPGKLGNWHHTLFIMMATPLHVILLMLNIYPTCIGTGIGLPKEAIRKRNFTVIYTACILAVISITIDIFTTIVECQLQPIKSKKVILWDLNLILHQITILTGVHMNIFRMKCRKTWEEICEKGEIQILKRTPSNIGLPNQEQKHKESGQ